MPRLLLVLTVVTGVVDAVSILSLGRVFVANTEARNMVRFDHPLGLHGHTVDNRLSAVGVNDGTTLVLDLNAHIDRQSDPATNLTERLASLSQPGMMV